MGGGSPAMTWDVWWGIGVLMVTKAKTKKPKPLTWPNGKKVAVSITVMFETWPDDSAPNYSVQTTHLKKGTVDHAAKAWSTYGGRVGVWRVVGGGGGGGGAGAG